MVNSSVVAISRNIANYSQLLKPVSISKRIEFLKILEQNTLSNRTKIQDALYKDLGKPRSETDLTEIIPVITEIRHAIKNVSKWSSDVAFKRSVVHYNSKASVKYSPKGHVLVLAPWNYPFNLIVSPLVSALAAGNRVVIKPSEFTQQTNLVLNKIISESFEPDYVNFVEGDASVAAELTQLPFNHIFFTGSPAIGKKVMAAAAKNLTSVTLELGGKSPCIIHKNANLKKAASRIIWGKFINCGQTCIAPDYVLIHKDIEKEFTELALKELKRRFPEASEGRINDEGYGKIIHNKHLSHIKDLLSNALSGGCDLLSGGTFDDSKRFFAPTLIRVPTPKSGLKIMEEEIFGPILPILSYNDESEIFQQVGSLPRPLATYVFSKDKSFIKECQDRIVTGGCVSNDVLSHFVHPHLPFGGVNNSGIGRAHGFYGFREMSNETAVLKTGPGPAGAEILGTPYTNFKKKIIERALRFL
ncbi:MAG: aldehyde dehydrogenase family protein [Balneolia bacterium]|nr:aldehyde dehydrogenase family protein [Balneolia bacterium]